MHRHVLIVMPHPDDETFACGGTIAMYTSKGVPVTYLCGTLGEMGRNMGKPPFATRESLPALREKELRAACEILGIGDLRLMGLRDKTVEFLDPAALADRIGAVIADVQPSLIITYHPIYGVHPDHCAMGAATVGAVAALEPERRPTVHCIAFGSRAVELGDPDVKVDIGPFLETKMAAIRAHRSQSEGMLKAMAEDEKLREQVEQQRSQERFWIYPFS